MFDLA